MDRTHGVGGGYSTRAGKSALPFGANKDADNAIVVVFQIASKDIGIQQSLSNAIVAAFKNFRFGDYGIIPIVVPQMSNAEVVMSVSDAETLAKRITPSVLKLLNMPQPLATK